MSRDTREIYQGLGTWYDRWTLVLDRTAVNRVRQSIFQRAGGRVLEIAVGTGKNFRYYPAGTRLVGIDFSPVMLEAAKAKAERHGISFEGQVSDASGLPFDNASFDSVTCSLAACTFVDPAAVFHEVRRVLRPGGQMLLVEHVRGTAPLVGGFCDLVSPLSRRFLGCHASRQTDRTLAESGFSVEVAERALGGILLGMVAHPLQ